MAQPNGVNCAGSAPSVSGGKLKISNIPIGAIALASMGFNTTDVIQLWVTDIWVPVSRFITKVGVLQGGTATTDNILAAIYDSQGVLLGSSPLAGSVLSGPNTFIELTLTLAGGVAAPGVQLYGPGQYYVAIQGSGTTAGALQTVDAPYLDICANSVVAGVFGTLPATITPPSSFTIRKGPIVYVY